MKCFVEKIVVQIHWANINPIVGWKMKVKILHVFICNDNYSFDVWEILYLNVTLFPLLSLYIFKDSPRVEGYEVRRGRCVGLESVVTFTPTTLLECAQNCSNHYQCTSFFHFNSNRCFLQNKTCNETSDRYSYNFFYDKGKVK